MYERHPSTRVKGDKISIWKFSRYWMTRIIVKCDLLRMYVWNMLRDIENFRSTGSSISDARRGKTRLFDTWFPFYAVPWSHRSANGEALWPRHGQWISDAPLTHSVRVFHGWLCSDVRHIAVLDRWTSMQILCSRGGHVPAIFEKRVA